MLPSATTTNTDTSMPSFLSTTPEARHSNNFERLLSLGDSSPSTPEKEKPRYRQRKPSPGLAARLKALGFGKDTTEKSTSPSPSERVGRIPEDQIRQIDLTHAEASRPSSLQRRGRAWSGASGLSLTSLSERVLEGGSRRSASVASSSDNTRTMTTLAEQGEMDSQKYRLPDHTNGNGTKAMSDTKQAHIERDVPPDDELPPPPLAKDSPPEGTGPGEFSPDVSSYFNPFGLPRAGSIYTLSRVSFANQLAQLTSLQLPDADSLSTKLSAIPTSKSAAKALMGAAEQIRNWISKASEVIAGLDGEDDVEWAAAGGREGLQEVDGAITRFEELINVYVSAIESLQNREDIQTVSVDELKRVVLQVETILSEWEKIRRTLKDVKKSVEIAMEWEELWNTVLGDIGNEIDILARSVFEMEENRHRSMLAEVSGEGVDLNELATIVEETPPTKTRSQANNRFSMTNSFPLSPNSPHNTTMAQDDSSLLALFARMQPLKASLEFLPMRLSVFYTRAEAMFPSACDELEQRRHGLEKNWKDLERDAESLRRELGEDRWVVVFRGAGRQAQKMYESVDRSLNKLKEAIDSGVHLNNPATMSKKIESYEAKKMHYGPAIERVLSIIAKGVQDRVTVNGEILRLNSDMQGKWDTLKEQMNDLDMSIEELQADKRNQQLRDSISSMVSNDRSTLGSINGTPGSSPASSVVMTGLSREMDPSTPKKNGKLRPGSHLPQPGRSRNVSAPLAGSQSLPRKPLLSQRSSVYGTPPGRDSSSLMSRQSSATPTGHRLPRPSLPGASSDGRPRWNSSVLVKDGIAGHTFTPLSFSTPRAPSRATPSPNPHSKPPSAHANRSIASSITTRSPLSRDNTTSPAPDVTPSRPSNSRLGSRARIPSTPGPYSQEVLSQSSPSIRPRQLSKNRSTSQLSAIDRRASLQPNFSSDPTELTSRMRSSSSLAGSRSISRVPSSSSLTPPSKPIRPASSLAANRRVSLLPSVSDCGGLAPTPKPIRPASSLAGNRRSSMLPTPRGRKDSSVNGRESPQAIAGAASAMGMRRINSSTVESEKKPWR